MPWLEKGSFAIDSDYYLYALYIYILYEFRSNHAPLISIIPFEVFLCQQR